MGASRPFNNENERKKDKADNVTLQADDILCMNISVEIKKRSDKPDLISLYAHSSRCPSDEKVRRSGQEPLKRGVAMTYDTSRVVESRTSISPPEPAAMNYPQGDQTA